MAIKKVKLPNNTTEDINDPRLPAVTTTDDGKVLSVSGGIWSANSKPSYTFSEIGSTPTSLGGYGITNWLVQSATDSLDSLTTAGVYKLSSQATPYGGYGNLFVIHGAGDTLAQMYFPYDADAVFFRRGTTSNFINNPWKAFYHSGNSNKSDVPWKCSTLTTNGNVSVTGNITATGTITPGSDSRIKDDQKDISSECAFSAIENLKPKTWVWNEKSNEKLNGKSAAGLVAQEVKAVLPDAVTISENGDIKDFHSLNYNTIQGYEIAAIKGLIEEVKSLKAEIEELKKQIK